MQFSQDNIWKNIVVGTFTQLYFYFKKTWNKKYHVYHQVEERKNVFEA